MAAPEAAILPSTRRPRFQREWLKVFIGVALIALTLFGQSAYGWATANARLDPALRNPTGRSNVIVVLNFTPDRFHNERIGQYGTFAGRDGSVNRLRLRSVTPERLKQLAAVPWVARIEPFK
jgi:hypothetical protein